MSYTYLQEQGEVSSAACFSDIPQSVLLKLNHIQDPSCCKGNEMEFSQNSPFGMTLRRSMDDHGRELLMWYAGDSPVRTYLQLDQEKVFDQGQEVACGPSRLESLAKYNPSLYLWKTAQCLLDGGLMSFSGTFPAWGMMLDGECCPVTMPEELLIEIEYGLVPSPVKMMADGFIGGPIRNSETWQSTCRLDHLLIGLWKNWIGREQNGRIKEKVICHPTLAAYLLQWPLNWTNLEPLAMDKFQLWQHSHGRSYLRD